jgi:2,4-dichlorophenol 6-monooxygenase
MTNIVETDVLVVGGGPAGGSSAVFLAKHGIAPLVILRNESTADTPRAHITNQRTMECLRDAGLEEACMKMASPSDHIAHSFWLRSMVGDELGRVWSWGADPERMGEYRAASPCVMNDLPQTYLEPILLNEAQRLGARVRFGWELQSVVQDADGVTATVMDRAIGEPITIRARYMIGADGARSRAVEQLGLRLVGKHGLANVFNLLCDIDLGSHVEHRHGSLYSVIQPGSSYWAPVGVFRMVRPWNRWLVALIVPAMADKPEPTNEDFQTRLHELVGDPAIPVKILSTSLWTVNDVYAEQYSVGRVFCMGDAVHRHPPTNGLGSNTCVQDAFNLAWKMAYVLQGKAKAALLDSYDAERQPVGKQIVSRANKSMLQNNHIWDLFGSGTRNETGETDPDALFATPEGRAAFAEAADLMRYEYHAHGVEMTRRYQSGAIVAEMTEELALSTDAELDYIPSTRPGSTLPHAWLVERRPSPLVSTLDVAGKARFALLTGHGGEGWRGAAAAAGACHGIDVEVVSIGPRLDYEDPYRSWAKLREVDESGCVLVRPDLVVAWRCRAMPENPQEALTAALAQILG